MPCENVFHDEIDCFAAAAARLGAGFCEPCRIEDEARQGEEEIRAQRYNEARLGGYSHADAQVYAQS